MSKVNRCETEVGSGTLVRKTSSNGSASNIAAMKFVPAASMPSAMPTPSAPSPLSSEKAAQLQHQLRDKMWPLVSYPADSKSTGKEAELENQKKFATKRSASGSSHFTSAVKSCFGCHCLVKIITLLLLIFVGLGLLSILAEQFPGIFHHSPADIPLSSNKTDDGQQKHGVDHADARSSNSLEDGVLPVGGDSNDRLDLMKDLLNLIRKKIEGERSRENEVKKGTNYAAISDESSASSPSESRPATSMTSESSSPSESALDVDDQAEQKMLSPENIEKMKPLLMKGATAFGGLLIGGAILSGLANSAKHINDLFLPAAEKGNNQSSASHRETHLDNKINKVMKGIEERDWSNDVSTTTNPSAVHQKVSSTRSSSGLLDADPIGLGSIHSWFKKAENDVDSLWDDHSTNGPEHRHQVKEREN